MEGYDVISGDEKKLGHVVGTHNGFLIIESGMLRKTKHAVPLDASRTDGGEVRLTLSKEMVEESPPVDDEADWQRIADYYGRPAEQEGQTAGVETDDQARAELRESLQSPDTDVGPQKGAVGIHQDRWEVKE
jgi:hypothetical protein